jgi:hypothetical protein
MEYGGPSSLLNARATLFFFNHPDFWVRMRSILQWNTANHVFRNLGIRCAIRRSGRAPAIGFVDSVVQ